MNFLNVKSSSLRICAPKLVLKRLVVDNYKGISKNLRICSPLKTGKFAELHSEVCGIALLTIAELRSAKNVSFTCIGARYPHLIKVLLKDIKYFI